MWKRVALYGLALAAGTGLLQWLDYRHLARAQSETFYIAVIALGFLACRSRRPCCAIRGSWQPSAFDIEGSERS